MTNDQQLIRLPASQLPTLSFTAEAELAKAGALESAALIARVSNDPEEQEAVAAQQQLYQLMRDVESARKLVKGPVIDLGRAIDEQVATFINEVRSECDRVAKLVADYAALKLERQRAAERAARLEQERIEQERRRVEEEERQRIERERQAALATAKSHDELDRINAEACEAQKLAQERAEEEARQKQAVAVSNIPVVTKTDGQIIRQDWEFEVTDVGLLARNHPSCVELKPRRSEIKSLLRQGYTLRGVKAWVVTKAGVRAAAKPEEVEV